MQTLQRCTKSTPHCEGWYREEDGLRPPCCTEHLKELVFRADELLTEHGFVHWIDFGTLLGAVRHQAFVPWDYDADMSILVEDATVFDRLRAIFTADGYDVTHNPAIPDELKIHLSATNRNHIDLYAYRRSADGMLRMAWAHNSENWFFPAHFLDKLESVTLYERQFLVPSPLHDFLRDYRYGPAYHIPIRYTSKFVYQFAPAEFTPLVADLFQERERYAIQVRKLKAQLPNKVQPTKFARWQRRLRALTQAEKRMNYLLRKSYDFSPKWRSRIHAALWTYMGMFPAWHKLIQRKYSTELTFDELTPAAYLLLHSIAAQRQLLATLSNALDHTSDTDPV